LFGLFGNAAGHDPPRQRVERELPGNEDETVGL
jgi:hypothetical protein